MKDRIDRVDVCYCSIRNKVGSIKNKAILMDDLIWPGRQHKPPLGKPENFKLTIVTLEEPPFVSYKNPPKADGTCPTKSVLVRVHNASSSSDGVDRTNNASLVAAKCASGFYVDLVIELSKKLQFTFDVYEVEDKTWGGKTANNEWNGIMRDLITNKADLAMTSLKMTKERSEYIDFTVPFMETVEFFFVFFST